MLLATGIGTLVLDVLVVAAEASESFATSLAYSERVGPLAGKTIWATVAFLVSWRFSPWRHAIGPTDRASPRVPLCSRTWTGAEQWSRSLP